MSPTATLDEEKKRVSVCVGCGSQIHDQYIMRVAPDLEWHATCLRCADCSQFLDESCTCFVRDGKTYCKRDYLRLFGTKCSLCCQGFMKADYVMRARDKVFHVECFRCAVCHSVLTPGEEFALREDGNLYCKFDNENRDRDSVTPCPGEMGGSPASGFSSGSAGNNNNNNSTTPNNNNNNNNNSNSVANSNGSSNNAKETKDGENKRSSSASDDEVSNSELILGSGRPGKKKGGPGNGKRAQHKGDHKTTRVRTVLNEKQLHTLRTCYNANPRPDALMKEQLTEMTGLSPRVIRVWFQNKRCKDKKRSMLLKQMQAQQEKVSVMSGQLQRPLNGVPMVATSPVRHEGPPGLQANPVEVQSYQTPWKALSEFAMQGELDHQHPPFQQLMSSFEHMDHGCHGSPPHSDIMMQGGYHHLPHDDMPNSVGSDFPGTPSELSSPLSQ